MLAIGPHGDVVQQVGQVGVSDGRNRLVGLGSGLTVGSLSLPLGAAHNGATVAGGAENDSGILESMAGGTGNQAGP